MLTNISVAGTGCGNQLTAFTGNAQVMMQLFVGTVLANPRDRVKTNDSCRKSWWVKSCVDYCSDQTQDFTNQKTFISTKNHVCPGNLFYTLIAK